MTAWLSCKVFEHETRYWEKKTEISSKSNEKLTPSVSFVRSAREHQISPVPEIEPQPQFRWRQNVYVLGLMWAVRCFRTELKISKWIYKQFCELHTARIEQRKTSYSNAVPNTWTQGKNRHSLINHNNKEYICVHSLVQVRFARVVTNGTRGSPSFICKWYPLCWIWVM